MLMTTDRRKSQGRRGSSSSSNDRRDRSDRRAADRRGKALKEQTDKPARQIKTSGLAGVKGFFRLVAILCMVSLALFSLAFIIFFANMDYFMAKAGERLLISAERVTIDPSSLTDRSSRANINLRVNNRLPLNVVLQNLSFTMQLGGYLVAKDAMYIPKAAIKGYSAVTVPVWCQVDSIMARRGLQKALEGQKTPTALPAISARSSALGEDLKTVSVFEGVAEFRLSAGGIEIPFRRRFVIGRR